MTPYLQDADFVLYQGNALTVLQGLHDASVNCVVTSPPYWGLRDYGTPGQLGLEETPELYVQRLVRIMAEVKRVLTDDGTLWLNLGDSYVSDPGKGGSGTPNGRNNRGENYGRERIAQVRDGKAVHGEVLRPYAVDGLRPKNLVGIPWRVAFALQDFGWYLRSDIVWAKPNPMPESITDRPTKAHEYVFLLTKQARYFFDQEAVREPAEWERWGDQTNRKHEGQQSAAGWIGTKSKRELVKRRTVRPGIDVNGGQGEGQITLTEGQGRNVRSVWQIPTQPYAEAHFATFPPELPRRCIAAGCPEGGVVLDPFAGAGTTNLVARNLGRRSIGIELNPAYCDLIATRLQQLSLLTTL